MKTTIGYFQNETFHSYWSYLYFKVGYTSRSKAIKALKSKYGKAVFTSFGNYTKLAKEFEDAYLVIMLSSQLLYTLVKNLLTLRKFLENCIFVTILPFISYQKVENPYTVENISFLKQIFSRAWCNKSNIQRNIEKKLTESAYSSFFLSNRKLKVLLWLKILKICEKRIFIF